MTPKELAIKHMALAIVAREIVTWHGRQMGSLPQPHEWRELVSKLTPAEVQELAHISAKLPTYEEFGRLHDLLDELGTFKSLYEGDRRYINEARCRVMDAITDTQNGHFSSAYANLTSVCSRLNWLLEDRRRESFEPKRFIPETQRPRLIAVRDKARELCDAFGRAAAVAG